MEQYDEQWLLELMRRDLSGGGEVRFRCADEALYRQVFHMLFEKNGLFSLLNQLGIDVHYTEYSNDDMFQAISFSVS